MFFFFVTGAPKIIYDASLSDTIAKNAGKTIEISAEVQGHPKPSITWYKDDEQLFSLGNLNIKSADNKTTLKISNAVAENRGIYRLVAENTVGSDEAVFDVTINDRPSPPQNLRIKEVNKNDVTITWDAPLSDGGAEITEYCVEKKDTNKLNYLSAGTTSPETRELKVSPCPRVCGYCNK